MPKLTNHEYFRRHDELRTIWRHAPELLRGLSPKQQTELRRYYHLDHRLTDEQLIAYRRRLDKAEHSLGSRAGKAYAVVQAALKQRLAAEDANRQRATQHVVRRPLPRTGPRHLTVSAVMRPEPDLDKGSCSRAPRRGLVHLEAESEPRRLAPSPAPASRAK